VRDVLGGLAVEAVTRSRAVACLVLVDGPHGTWSCSAAPGCPTAWGRRCAGPACAWLICQAASSCALGG
jgi:hypothetical protein